MTAPGAFANVAALRECWHPVAFGCDLGDRPAHADLLGEPLVLWRGPGGEPRANADLCVHRGTALSLGWINGDELVCPYHGWRYRADGRCAAIPQLEDPSRVPPKARIGAYRCQERYGLIWVALGEPRWPLPEVPELADGGWAVVTEFPAAIPLAFIVLLVFVEGSRSSPALATRTTAVVLAGGLVTAAVLMAYNSAAFGSPFHLGYASEQGFEQLRVGLFGITYPTLDRLRGILFSAYRGVIPLAPLTLAAALGLGALAADRATRRPAVVATGIVIFYLLLNASYYYWEGGWAYGPRHITPALPFLFLGLAPLWDRWRGAARWVLVAACVWGAALGLIAVSTTAQPPGDVMSPVTELLWPAFRDGDLSLNNQGFADARADEGRLRNHLELHAGWNLGELAGFHGRASLIPLGAIWVIGLGGLVRSRQT